MKSGSNYILDKEEYPKNSVYRYHQNKQRRKYI
jgi:hypothetical protein